MDILINNILSMPFWSKMANLHGSLAMLSLILFGANLILLYQIGSLKTAVSWLKKSLFFLFIVLLLLDIFGLSVYIPYRVEGGPRTILKSSENVAWLHDIVFEHKEFLAYAPPILIFTAFFIIVLLGDELTEKKNIYLKRSIIISVMLSLLFVLIVAGEAVLVTKVVPI